MAAPLDPPVPPSLTVWSTSLRGTPVFRMVCQEIYSLHSGNKRDMSYRIFSASLALILTSVVPSSALAQTPGQATGQPTRLPGQPPLEGREATRWEPWSAMRMAAGTVLGWKVGISADSFPHQNLFTTLVDADALKLSNIEASSGQKVDARIPKNV